MGGGSDTHERGGNKSRSTPYVGPSSLSVGRREGTREVEGRKARRE